MSSEAETSLNILFGNWYKVSIVEFDRCSDGGMTSVSSYITWTGQSPSLRFADSSDIEIFDQYLP